VCKRKKLAKRDKENSECIAPLKSGRYSGIHNLNNGMGFAGIIYFINSSKQQPNCVLEHDEIMIGIITKKAKTYSSCDEVVYEISEKNKMVLGSIKITEAIKKGSQLFWNYDY
jgi:hypothetical protein